MLQRRGRLKVFLGMCPGVGKTYAMLEDARREQGRDVVIGYVETHGRKETDALAEGLPKVPRRSLEYRGVTLTEMDLDAVLARKPQLALVDELAHTNAPGSRHPKRYQDVRELLDAGIDVFTTLNVQHVESRAEIVREVTGATIHETVPDSVLDEAEIELVDLPPDELLRRLAEGKVYVPDRAQTAAAHFSAKAISSPCANSRCGSPPNTPARMSANISKGGTSPGPGRVDSGCWLPSAPVRSPNRWPLDAPFGR